MATRTAITAIDCHAHVMLMDRPLSPLRHSSPARDVRVEDYLRELDGHGISHGLLTAPSFYGSDNSLLLEALAAGAGRLRGTAIVEPTISVAELQALQLQGVCGVRLNWIKRDVIPDAGSPVYQLHFARLRELGWHVEVFLEGRLLSGVLPLIRRSGVRVVLDHFGCPEPAQGAQGEHFRQVLEAVSAGDTWVKLSAPYRLGAVPAQPYVDALMAAGGPERLVWATDWPFVGHERTVSYAQCVQWLREWVPDERRRQQILVDTPQALFGF